MDEVPASDSSNRNGANTQQKVVNNAQPSSQQQQNQQQPIYERSQRQQQNAEGSFTEPAVPREKGVQWPSTTRMFGRTPSIYSRQSRYFVADGPSYPQSYYANSASSVPRSLSAKAPNGIRYRIFYF